MNADMTTPFEHEFLLCEAPMRFVTGTLHAWDAEKSRELVIGIGTETRTFALATDFIVDECVVTRPSAVSRPVAGAPRVRVAFTVDRTSNQRRGRYVARALSVEYSD